MKSVLYEIKIVILQVSTSYMFEYRFKKDYKFKQMVRTYRKRSSDFAVINEASYLHVNGNLLG